MAETFLYLTTTGRKTGLPRDIEIWFVEHAGCFYLVSEHRERSNWVRNIVADARVSFSVGTRADRAATRARGDALGRVVSVRDEPALHRAVCELMDDKYGWSDGLVVELAPLDAR